MGVLPETEGLNAIDVFENTKSVIAWETWAPQFKRSDGDLSPRRHIKWPRANFRLEYAICRCGSVFATRSGMMKGTLLEGLANASSTRANGSCSVRVNVASVTASKD